MDTLKRTNPEQYNAYQMIANTHHSFFLTGKAGTGKTTFLKKIQQEVQKNFLVLFLRLTVCLGALLFNAAALLQELLQRQNL